MRNSVHPIDEMTENLDYRMLQYSKRRVSAFCSYGTLWVFPYVYNLQFIDHVPARG